MTKDRNRGITHSKWFLPSFSFVLGLVILAVACWPGMSRRCLARRRPLVRLRRP